MLLGEKSFCKLKNELNVIYFSNVAWNLVLMTFGSFVHPLVQNSEFLRHLCAIYEFPCFYLIYFWFLILTHSYESLDGVHASFEIFGILFEQCSQFKVEIVKIGKILGCLKFGSADSPRVRGGRSAVHETCLPEALQKSFKQQNYIADGPLMYCGRSALGVLRRILTARLIMSYKGISLVDYIHLGAYEMFELDIYMLLLLATRWLNGLNG